MNTSRQAVALLVALAAVIVVLSALAATLAALASTQRAVVVSDVHERQLDLLHAGEALAREWMMTHAANVVLPPGGGPLRVADDQLRIAGNDARLQVWMFDGLAGIPIDAARVGGALRGALPGNWATVVLPTSEDPSAPDAIERTTVADAARRFPIAPVGPIVRWSAPNEPLPDMLDAIPPKPGLSASLVEIIGFRSAGRINRNTAPEWLLSAVYHLRERGGLDEALLQRERGIMDEAEDPEGATGVRLVARSDQWQALVVATWNGRRRSWWVELSGNSPSIQIVQRHDADE